MCTVLSRRHLQGRGIETGVEGIKCWRSDGKQVARWALLQKHAAPNGIKGRNRCCVAPRLDLGDARAFSKLAGARAVAAMADRPAGGHDSICEPGKH